MGKHDKISKSLLVSTSNHAAMFLSGGKEGRTRVSGRKAMASVSLVSLFSLIKSHASYGT
jgi:hypothetical protein